MLETIAIFIFLASLSGIVLMFILKMPLLAVLPKTTPVFEEKGENAIVAFFTKIKERVKTFPLIQNFSFEILLQKVLSRFRVLALKIESKTGRWLEALRKKAQENNKPKEDDKYWDQLEKKDKNLPM